MNQPMTRRTVLAAGVAAASTMAVSGAATAADLPEAAIEYKGWVSAADWTSGTHDGTAVADAARPGIVLDHVTGAIDYKDKRAKKSAWESAAWTSPAYPLGFGATELVASWNALTPAGTWVQVELEPAYDDGTPGPWYVMGRWASSDVDISRCSVAKQADGRSTVDTDTVSVDDAGAHRFTGYRLRVTLYRKPGTTLTPVVWRIGAMASDVPDRFEVPASVPSAAQGLELPVPRYSQNIHKGQYPEYDNGGEAWCSPTSSQMILEYWGRKPTAEDLAWVNPEFADPQVCHAARSTYDYTFGGCGNWPFNTAYAATYADMEAIVTRLRTLSDLERLIAAGIPVITSQSFRAEELDGAGYGTAGHLMTVIGFTAEGDVIANDPASDSNEAVRHVYDRRQFENIWLRTKRYNGSGDVATGSGGVCYLFKPVDRAWPWQSGQMPKVWG